MTPKIEYIEGHIIYENHRPHVKSRHGYLPGVIQLPNGELLVGSPGTELEFAL